MADLTPQKRARLIAISAILAGLATAAVVANRSFDTSKVHDVLMDAGFVHAGKGGTVTDLDSIEIPGGETGRSVVNLDPGATVSEVIAAPGWSIESTTQNGTLVTVIVKNNTGKPARFSGMLHFNPAPVDAGVD